MATWITHLRIAEIISQKLPELDEVSFLYGNLAPDSGLPNEDWTVYDPPKEVTHFLVEPRGEDAVRDMVFYRDYLQGMDAEIQKFEYSFRLGYYTHLVTDEFWWRKIARTTETSNQELFSRSSREDAFWAIKTDWYGLDHKYLRDHPDYPVWKRFFESDIPNNPLPFMPQNAFEIQMKYIKAYYTTPDPDRVLDRKYPYLNEKVLDLFIGETSIAIIRLIHLLECNPQVEFTSSLSLLSPEESASYYPPLGD
ncbi:MAG TPA: hypothetical protein DIW44_14975 [Anaerolineaceae bacterium]|nr:hypothetical protein [Anaerolineaceae bacterium]